MAKRPTRPKRIDWFAFDAVAFKDDPRMQHLTAREKSFWLSMLVNSFHNKGMMVADPAVVADQTGATVKEAETLLSKLFLTKLLVHTDPDEKLFDGVSKRMVVEFGISAANSKRFSEMGTMSAEKNGTTNLKLCK